jgi:hypothetical protein
MLKIHFSGIPLTHRKSAAAAAKPIRTTALVRHRREALLEEQLADLMCFGGTTEPPLAQTTLATPERLRAAKRQKYQTFTFHVPV